MPIKRVEVSVPANGQIDNVLAGSIYEFLPWDAQISFANNAEATGLQVTISTGTDLIQEEAPPNVAGVFPKINEDFDLQDVAPAGERVVIKVRNTTAGAIILRSSTIFTPV